MRRLRQNRKFRMDVIPDLEHSLFEWRGRLEATELLTEHVFSCYGAATPEA